MLGAHPLLQVPALTWDARLAASAAAWASKCQFGPSHSPGVGENLGFGYARATDAISAWYKRVRPAQQPATQHATRHARKELTLLLTLLLPPPSLLQASLYDYAAPGWSSKTGLFTQIVWRDTKAVGCATNASCPWATHVCQYSPPGAAACAGAPGAGLLCVCLRRATLHAAAGAGVTRRQPHRPHRRLEAAGAAPYGAGASDHSSSGAQAWR